MTEKVEGTVEEIKKDERLAHCKVIFLSAKNKESDIEKGMNLGANLYVVKPFSTKKLVEPIFFFFFFFFYLNFLNQFFPSLPFVSLCWCVLWCGW